MHHVPYTHILHSGKTVIQEVYDSHYQGAAEAQQFPVLWKALRGKIDADRYNAVLARLEYQAGHAIVWRDAVCNWFFRESGIADERRRVGHAPGRTEAESLQLDGYGVTNVTPWEDASGGRAIACPVSEKSCSATLLFQGNAGWYNLRVQYFDTTPGNARYVLFLNDQTVTTWVADGNLPGKTANGDTSTRAYIDGLALRRGDVLRIVGTPDGDDRAAIDYLELRPQ
jgi:alpha-glucuronidase